MGQVERNSTNLFCLLLNGATPGVRPLALVALGTNKELAVLRATVVNLLEVLTAMVVWESNCVLPAFQGSLAVVWFVMLGIDQPLDVDVACSLHPCFVPSTSERDRIQLFFVPAASELTKQSGRDVLYTSSVDRVVLCPGSVGRVVLSPGSAGRAAQYHICERFQLTGVLSVDIDVACSRYLCLPLLSSTCERDHMQLLFVPLALATTSGDVLYPGCPCSVDRVVLCSGSVDKVVLCSDSVDRVVLCSGSAGW